MDKNNKDEISGYTNQKSLLRNECDFLFEDNLSIIIIIDPENGRIIDANKSAVEFYKYPKKKLISMTIFEINILPREEIIAKLNMVKNKNKSAFVFNHKLADDSIRTVRVQSSKIHLNDRDYIFSVIYDDTGIIELENEHSIINKQLKDSLIFNQNLIKNASEGIIVYDRDLRYTLWNNFMVKATGVQASQVLGRHTTEIFKQGTYSEVTGGLKKALQGEVVTLDSIEFINPVTKESGFTREVYSPNYDSDGNITGVVCIVSDITNIIKYQKSLAKKNNELKELNLILSEKLIELEKAKEKAEESDRLKSSFLAHVSHEIRTPLNSIVGFSTLLKDVKDPRVISKYINIIQTNNLFLLNIIGDILTYSLIETNNISIHPIEFDLIYFLKGIYNNFKQIVNDKIDLKLEILDITNLIIYTDENKLNQILSNLLTNSFKFTNVGTIEFGIHSYDHEKVVLYVKDSGIGIAEENQQIIFSRFNKLNSLKPGSGLGLSICRALCEKINGKIHLKSELNEGATFYVEIPHRYLNQGEEYDK